MPVAELRISKGGRVPVASTTLTLCHVYDVICTSAWSHVTASHSVKLYTLDSVSAEPLSERRLHWF